MLLEDGDQGRLDGDAAVLAPLAADVEDGTVIAASDVADIGIEQLVGAHAGQQDGQHERAVTLEPVAASPRLGVVVEGGDQRADGALEERLGERLACLDALVRLNDCGFIARGDLGRLGCGGDFSFRYCRADLL
jgi:hypothetical protein